MERSLSADDARAAGAGGRTRILFVCSGNTCRSPLAEALARSMIAAHGWDVVVESAGISADEDAPASDAARTVAREAGLELDGHQARLLTRPLVMAADLVLVMGTRQHDFVRVLAPEAMDRVHRLRGYASRGAETADVRDPFGGDLARYRGTLAELRGLVERSLLRFGEEVRRLRT